MAGLRLSASSLDLRALYYFVHVAEYGSFSRAAAALSVGQPLLSRQIRALEESMRVQLLYRHGRGVALSEAGQLLLGHAQEIFRKLSQSEIEIAALRGTAVGTVTIALPPLLGSVLSAALIRRVRAEHPRVSIALREGFTAEALEWMGAGEIDVGIMFNPPHLTTLITEHVTDDCIHLLGTPGSLELASGSSVDVHDLAQLPLILPPQPQRLRKLIDTAAQAAGTALCVEVEVIGTNTVLELVRERIGYTVLPSLLVRGEVAAGRLASWRLSPVIDTHLFAVTSMQRPQTLATKAVLKTISAIFAETLR